MSKEKIAEITLKVDSGGTKLIITSPKVGPAKPSIGVLRDEKGNYYFALGHKDSVIAPSKLPKQIKQAIEKFVSGKTSTQFQMSMPSCSDLMLSSGKYMTYKQYQNKRVSRLITPKQKVWWPYLEESVYKVHVQLCQQMMKRFASKIHKVR